MRQLLHTVERFLASEDGPTAVEYAVLIGLIVIGTVAAVGALSSSMSGTFNSVATTITPS
jgi:pilus assembly protein Flp/PilA